jgi:hypothetical protein
MNLITNITVSNINSVSYGGAYYGTSGSALTLTSSSHDSFSHDLSSTSGGVFYFEGGSTLDIALCSFTDISNVNYGAVFYLDASYLTADSCEFTKIYEFNSGGVFYGLNSEATFTNITVDTIY